MWPIDDDVGWAYTMCVVKENAIDVPYNRTQQLLLP
jgi:hypothetical protein